MPWWDSTVNQPKMKSRFFVIFGDMFIPSVSTITKPSFEVDTKSYKLMNHHFNYPGTLKWNPIQVKLVCMNPYDVRGPVGQREQKGLDTADLLWQIIQNSGYYYPDIANSHYLSRVVDGESSDITTPEKASMVANGFGGGLYSKADYRPGGSDSRPDQRVRIIQISTDTNASTLQSQGKVYPVEMWDLVNPMVSSINFGDLSYADDNLVEYTLDIVYDYAKYEVGTEDSLLNSVVGLDSKWQSYSNNKIDESEKFKPSEQAQRAAMEDFRSTPTYQKRVDEYEADALADEIFGNSSDILNNNPK